ncbi:MAG: tRNA (adenosine(37)-N6)-threonylcarbamoyltransferase complex transferase subunit TsaD [Candidatus Manganitrophus sp. SA1]|nr:tRNA (adenosine(37)-N6)-threonylcarbamoyltransferase complex transferase subunit TsaD [Candidatus Manganitrophus morganii]
MIILGIETSCDETAVAVTQDGKIILSDLLSSQIDLHRKYGGVVPELACRRHIEVIGLLVKEAIEKSGRSNEQLNAIAVTMGPGLVGALLVGVSIAKSLAYSLQIPLLGIHHLEGHISAAFIEHEDIVFPSIALVVSGGHTNLYYMPQRGKYRLLGKTIDDAAGEILDKGARMLGYSYPGGPVIDRLAQKGDPERIPFPRPYRSSSNLDFSFSGLKTSLMHTLFKMGKVPEDYMSSHPDIAAGYQSAIVDTLVEKTFSAVQQEDAKSVMLVGGVAANSLLRKKFLSAGERLGIAVYIPSSRLCTDNGAMIAMAGMSHLEEHHFSSLDLNPSPNLELMS